MAGIHRSARSHYLDDTRSSSSSSQQRPPRHDRQQPLLEHRVGRSSPDELSESEDEDDALLSAESSNSSGNMTGFTATTANMTRLGMLRAYWLGIVVCIGGFLCTFGVMKPSFMGSMY
jgi:hypothetical protein